MREIETVQVVPWEPGEWGVDIKFENGDGQCYFVGKKLAAEAEAERVRRRDVS